MKIYVTFHVAITLEIMELCVTPTDHRRSIMWW